MNPFIPRKKANVALVAGNAGIEIFSSLKNLDLQVIPTIKCEDVYKSIAYHPDIVIHPVDHKTLVIAPNVFDYYKEALKGLDLRLIKGEKKLGRKYPDTIAYNVGRIGNKAIHNFKYTDEVLKFYLEKEKIEFINIKQGYSKCSLAIAGEKGIITSDPPMYKKLKSLGYNSLLIKPGHIYLEGQEYGFIGGATGNLSQNTILFSGHLNQHPNQWEIIKFLLKNKLKIKYLSKEEISDIGSIISLYCN